MPSQIFQKLTPEEFEQLKVKGWGRSSPVYNAILSLKVTESILVKKTEWRRNKAPSSICRAIEKKWPAKKLKYKCVTLADGSGWGIKRIA